MPKPKLKGIDGGRVLSDEQEKKRAEILQRIDPRGYGLFDQANFEGDDLYLLLAPTERGAGGDVKSVRIPSEIVNACDYLLAIRATPFRNFSELTKSAIVLLLRTLADMGRGDSKWRTSVRTINIGTAKTRIMRKSQDIEGYLAGSGDAVRELMGRGDPQGALDLFHEVRSEIEKLDDGQWREKGQAWVEEMERVVATLKVPAPETKKPKLKLKKGGGK